MRHFIDIINEAAGIAPIDITPDDGDVEHALYAVFDDEGEAYMRYWGTSDGRIALQAIHNGEGIRGRDMVRWLAGHYGRPIAVVEAIPEALNFWDAMEAEGLVASVEMAEGFPSDLEQISAPLPQS